MSARHGRVFPNKSLITEISIIMSYPFLPNNHLRISHSSRITLTNCKRKFQFRKFFQQVRRQREGQSALKAELGKALHHGYQEFVRHVEMPMDERTEHAIFEYMKAYPIELDQNANSVASLETGFATLNEMISSQAMMGYELARIKCHDGVERDAIEVPFEIVLNGFELPGKVSVSLTGFIDAIFFNSHERTYHVLDVKTSGRGSKDGDFSPLYQFNEQCVSYGFVLEYIQQRKIENFQVSYLHCKVDMKEPKALRYDYVKTQKDVQDWYNALLMDLSNIKTYMEIDWFPRDPTGQACFAYGNRCEYFELCGYNNETCAKALMPTMEEQAEMETDEATASKTGAGFEPWIKFGIEMPKAKTATETALTIEMPKAKAS